MMRGRSRQIWMAGLGLGVVGAVIATGVLGDSGPQETGAVGSGVAAVVDPPDRDPAPSTNSTAGPMVITLGDLDPLDASGGDSPYDPCTVIAWADLPAEVRPASDTTPSPHRPADGDDDFTLGCRFGNSGPITKDGGEAASGEFMVTVMWGTAPPLSLNPARYAGATATTFGGRAGVQRSSIDPHGIRMCTGLMPVTGGVAGVSVTNSRFPHTDPCDVAAAALTAIATKIP